MNMQQTAIGNTLAFSGIWVLLSGCTLLGQPQTADGARIGELKAQILQLAEAAQGECEDQDNDPRVRQELDPLISELVSLVPDKPEGEELPEVTGAWQQVWSDLPAPAFEGLCISAQDTYQVVFNGYYYNISNLSIGDLDLTSFLRGVYDVQPEYLPIEFTKTTYVEGSLKVGTDLTGLAQQVENGQLQQIPNAPPDGAAGTRGELKNLYVDEELRIITGAEPLEQSEVFILKRTETVQ